jgi:predicted ABC-type exoprotein transport system permease subunit
MPSDDKPARKPIVGTLAIAGLLAVVLLVVSRALRAELSLAVVLGYLLAAFAAYALFLICMPFFFWIVGEAGYRTFLRPYLRAWHIRRIRNKRLWDEAAAREDTNSA